MLIKIWDILESHCYTIEYHPCWSFLIIKNYFCLIKWTINVPTSFSTWIIEVIVIEHQIIYTVIIEFIPNILYNDNEYVHLINIHLKNYDFFTRFLLNLNLSKNLMTPTIARIGSTSNLISVKL